MSSGRVIPKPFYLGVENGGMKLTRAKLVETLRVLNAELPLARLQRKDGVPDWGWALRVVWMLFSRSRRTKNADVLKPDE